MTSELDGKVCVITGGACGIGRALAERVIAGGGEAIVVDKIPASADSATTFLQSDLSSVRGMTQAVDDIQRCSARIDILFNNVGGIFPDRTLTVEGLEATFALNHLSYFVLANRLASNLQAAPSPVLLNVSSSHYRAGRMDFDDLQGIKYSMNKAYCQSKLANILFSREFPKRHASSNISVCAVHPGVIDSNFGDNLKGPWRFLWDASKFLRQSPDRAATDILQVAQLAGREKLDGQYFVKSAKSKLMDHALNVADASRLWHMSEEIVRTTERYISTGHGSNPNPNDPL